MNSSFRFEVPVRVVTGNSHRGRLYSCFLARGKVENVRIVAGLLAPPQIHPQQHLRPILGVDPACALFHRDNRWSCVVFPIQLQSEFLVC